MGEHTEFGLFRLAMYEGWYSPGSSYLGTLLFFSLPLQISQGLLLQYADDTALIWNGPAPVKTGTVMNSQLVLIQ